MFTSTCHRVGLAAVCLVIVLVAPAAAQPSADDLQFVRHKHAEARAEFLRGDYPAALALAADGLRRKHDDRSLLELRGNVLLATGDCLGALDAYQAFLDAGARGAARRKVKDIIATLRVCRKTFLVIDVTNGPANVYLDARSQGVWCVADPGKPRSCRKGLLARRYTVFIEREGFEPIRTSVRVRPRRTTKRSFTLQENPSALTLAVTPPDAAIRLDGAEFDPAQSEPLPAGEYQLQVTASGCFVAHESSITAQRGQPISRRIDLVEQLTLQLAANPHKPPDPLDPRPAPLQPGFKPRVELDGKRVALRDGVIQLPAGSQAHKLRVHAPEYIEQTIDIPAQRPPDCTLSLALDPVPRGPWDKTPPDDGPSLFKRVAMISTAGTAAVSLGLAMWQSDQVRRQRNHLAEVCPVSGNGVPVCSVEDYPLYDDLRATTARANWLFTAGATASLGLLWAWHLDEDEPPESTLSLRRKLSIGATGAIAVAGVGVGTLYGLRSSARSQQIDELCDSSPTCNDAAPLLHQAGADANLANVAFTIAAVAAITANALWWTKPSKAGESRPQARVRIHPHVGPDQIGAVLSIQR